jgi:chromosome segregation ATPase
MKFGDYISNVNHDLINAKENISEDVSKLDKIYNFIKDIVEEYNHIEYKLKKHPVDPKLARGVLEEYKIILDYLREIDDTIDIIEGELEVIQHRIPQLEKHIKSGFIAFDEWEPPAWEMPDRIP